MGARRIRFERLIWESGERQDAPPPSPPLPHAEAEAVRVMQALGGHTCGKCHKPLTEADGYGCCEMIYCPVCGRCAGWAANHNEHCAHLVLRTHNGLSYLEVASSSAIIAPGVRDELKALLKLDPPARRLKGQKIRGYPTWSPEQIADAYGPNARYAPVLWGLQMRAAMTAEARNQVMLGACLCPDIKTSVPYGGRFVEQYWCADAEAAHERVRAWATSIAEGTERLRTMEPVRIVPD